MATSLIRSILDAGENLDWSVSNYGERQLNPGRVAAYISRFSEIPEEKAKEELRDFATLVLANTNYISFSTFHEAITEALLKLHDVVANSPIYLFFSQEAKFGSEHWIVQLLWPLLKKFNTVELVLGNLAEIPAGSNIVILDDMIYSGTNMAEHILGYTNRQRSQHSWNFHLVTAYANPEGIQYIRETITKSRFSNKSTVAFYHKAQYTSLKAPSATRKSFGLEFSSQVPIYFDHKVANEFGSYPMIYLCGYIPIINKNTGPLVDLLPSREPIERFQLFYRQAKLSMAV